MYVCMYGYMYFVVMVCIKLNIGMYYRASWNTKAYMCIDTKAYVCYSIYGMCNAADCAFIIRFKVLALIL